MSEVNIGIEQILAAVLSKVGAVTISKEELLTDYSQYAVSVDPREEEIVLSLVDLKGVDLEEISE